MQNKLKTKKNHTPYSDHMVDTHTYTLLVQFHSIIVKIIIHCLLLLDYVYYLREVGTSCLNLEISMTLDFRPFFSLRTDSFQLYAKNTQNQVTNTHH